MRTDILLPTTTYGICPDWRDIFFSVTSAVPLLLPLQVTIHGKLADSWTIRGLQPNNYYATAEVPVAVPLELDQLPNDYITFHPDTFKLGPVSPKDVVVPDGCADKCPLTSVCSILQLQASMKGAVRSWGQMSSLRGFGGQPAQRVVM